MNAARCDRITFADLSDYAAGELPEAGSAGLEDHLFSCADCGTRAGEFHGLVRGIGSAVLSASVGGFLTDAVLNRLSRDGVRVRTYSVSSGAVVPCAVWDDDELLVLRMRGDLGQTGEFTLTQRLDGIELVRVTGQSGGDPHADIVYALPAAVVRQLPAGEIEVVLTAHEGDQERAISSYTLVHGGFLHRR
jgi:hypothetical protein